MNNKELFKSTFLKVRVDENKVKEIIKMKDTKKAKKSYAKKIIAIAACIGCALSAAMVVNAATDGEIAKEVIGWFENVDGEKVEIVSVGPAVENSKPNEKLYYCLIETSDTSQMIISETADGTKIYGAGEIHFY